MSRIGIYSDDKFRRLFSVLREIEQANKEIDAKELADASGYKLSSLRTYIAKKLKGFLLHSSGRGRFKVNGSFSIEEDKFVQHMSQKNPKIVVDNNGLVDRILKRSIDAYFLAVELYNRPTQSNRIEAFCIMMINAWELLIKAEIINNKGENALFYKNDNSKSISIRDALKIIFLNEKDPVRRNIEYLADLRDKAVHLLIPELQGEASRLFQASVFNYIHRYNLLTNSNISSKLGTGLISLVIDTRYFEPSTLKEIYDVKTADEISQFMERFRVEEKELNSSNFAIPIEYKLTLTKNSQEGYINLQSGDGNRMGFLVEVPKDVDKTHPYRQNEAIRIICERIQDMDVRFNSYDFQAILYKEKIKSSKSSKYYYLIDNPETHRYSHQFIEFVVDKLINNLDYLERCRESYKRFLDKRKTDRKPSQ